MSNVIDLFQINPQRINKLRQWHAEQAGAQDPSVAILHFNITAGGDVGAQAVGVEPEHLASFIEELDRVRELLAARLPDVPVLPHHANVVSFQRPVNAGTSPAVPGRVPGFLCPEHGAHPH